MNRSRFRLFVLTAIATISCLLGSGSSPQPALAQIRERSVTEGGNARVVPPHERPGQRRWTLGITAETAEIGVRIREVLSRSPAERAGLERGDLIVNVEGYQVGRVGGRDYPLDRELDARADSNGRVRLLVQNRRNNQLVNIDVRLEQDRPGPGPNPGPGDRKVVVTGEASYRDRSALPRDAELRVKVTRKKILGSETLAERTFATRGRVPITFEMRFDVDRDDWERTCDVSAEIYSNGRRLYVEDGSYRFKPSESPVHVKLEMRRE